MKNVEQPCWQIQIVVVDGSVIVPHDCHKIKNGWLKYDHRLMYKKYANPLPYCDMWGSSKTYWDGPANKKYLFLHAKSNWKVRKMQAISLPTYFISKQTNYVHRDCR